MHLLRFSKGKRREHIDLEALIFSPDFSRSWVRGYDEVERPEGKISELATNSLRALPIYCPIRKSRCEPPRELWSQGS